MTWQQLSQVLSWQFLSVGKRGLDDEQLSMLRDKIVGMYMNDKHSQAISVIENPITQCLGFTFDLKIVF